MSDLKKNKLEHPIWASKGKESFLTRGMRKYYAAMKRKAEINDKYATIVTPLNPLLHNIKLKEQKLKYMQGFWRRDLERINRQKASKVDK
tara:strand:+ start:150 stop:419 length:270 start_codon:yes stop_codon:yes gene_type:complete